MKGMMHDRYCSECPKCEDNPCSCDDEDEYDEDKDPYSG